MCLERCENGPFCATSSIVFRALIRGSGGAVATTGARECARTARDYFAPVRRLERTPDRIRYPASRGISLNIFTTATPKREMCDSRVSMEKEALFDALR